MRVPRNGKILRQSLCWHCTLLLGLPSRVSGFSSPRTWRSIAERTTWPVDPARKKVRKSSQLFRRLNQAQEQQRSGQTGRDGKRCAALLGLTRRGWHPAGRGQLPGSTTGKATTEALAVDAICLPSDMLQDRIWGLSCKAAFLVEGQVEQVGSAYLGG